METGFVFYFDVTTMIVVSIIVFGFLGFMTGASAARNWQSPRLLIFYCLLLSFGERFMAHTLVWDRFYLIFDVFNDEEGTHFAFDTYTFVAFGICLVFAFVAFFSTRASLMVRQYPWLYERTGPFGWRSRT